MLVIFKSIGIEAAPTFNNKKKAPASPKRGTPRPVSGAAKREEEPAARIDLKMEDDADLQHGASWGDDCDLSD